MRLLASTIVTLIRYGARLPNETFSNKNASPTVSLLKFDARVEAQLDLGDAFFILGTTNLSRTRLQLSEQSARPKQQECTQTP